MMVKYVRHVCNPMSDGAGDGFADLLNSELAELKDKGCWKFSVHINPPLFSGAVPNSAFIFYELAIPKQIEDALAKVAP